MSDVQEINDIHELSARRLLWNSLLAGTADASFFHTLDWLLTYWDHFGDAQRLRVLIVSAAGKPIGVAPLVVRRETSEAGPVRVLTYPMDDRGTFYSPIGPNPAATLLAAMRHVESTPRDWDLLDLRGIDVDGRDRGRTERAMRMVGLHAKGRIWRETSVVELAGSWEDYWRGRPDAWRRIDRSVQRRLPDGRRVRYVRYRPPGAARGDGDPRWDLFDAAMSMSDDQEKLEHASDYLRDSHASAARAGAVDLNLLLIDDCPAAFAYNYHREGRVQAIRVGRHPRFAEQTPGILLQRMMLADSFVRGDTLFDWGVGSEAAAGPWLTSVRRSWRFTHYPIDAPRARILRFSRWVRSLAGRSVAAETVR